MDNLIVLTREERERFTAYCLQESAGVPDDVKAMTVCVPSLGKTIGDRHKAFETVHSYLVADQLAADIFADRLRRREGTPIE